MVTPGLTTHRMRVISDIRSLLSARAVYSVSGSEPGLGWLSDCIIVIAVLLMMPRLACPHSVSARIKINRMNQTLGTYRLCSSPRSQENLLPRNRNPIWQNSYKHTGSTQSIDQVSLVLLDELSVEVCSHPLVIVQRTLRDGQVMACNVMLQSDASWGKMINLSVAIVRNIVIQSQRCGDII